MAENIVAENSILVYDFAISRSRRIPFEKIMGMHPENDAFVSLFACSGLIQMDECEILSCSVNKNQSMRQCRIGLEFSQIFLWALMFGDYFHPPHRRSDAKTIHYQNYFE
jgi:hypothetical protein